MSDEDQGSGVAEARQRVDKWLWYARLAKTRTAAQKLAVSGRVRINRERNETASRPVRPGDVLTIALDGAVRVLRVVAPGCRRGPPPEARLLYEDLSPPVPLSTGQAPSPRGGRPTKRNRRAMEALRSPNPSTGKDFLDSE